ncbi:ABC transporter permease [Nocardia uniformis]|uniref:ABC transporter permease n=1 Tax=Nocardia uniformis TaxID=53432 RepID=A0A849BRQ9_9NOCA|nr:ABC transporter permease [Nocardia uniformis]NNH69303.1 ABC transporter permease [Nocardia uniformis]
MIGSLVVRDPLRELTAGVGTLLRFALRRERFTLPCWVLGVALLLASQSVGSQRLYETPAQLARLRETMGGNAAMVAMGGPARLLETIGGEVLFEVFAYLAIVIALMNMFVVGRHTRTDEESGRAELIRSARVGRRAPVVAALTLAALADFVVAVVIFAVAAGTGLPAHGSLLLAIALAGLGITFAALTAVVAQLFEYPRGVYGSVSLLLAAAYVLRAVGDVGDGTLSWLSPIGWGQRSYPYVDNRWWPVGLFAGASAVLIAIAFILLERRDFGAGLLRHGTGRSTASWAFRSPLALAWRIQRGSLIGWSAGVFVLCAAYGSFADSIEEFLADYPEIAAYLPGGIADAVDAYLALSLSIGALLTAAYAIVIVLRAHTEEVTGRAEPILAASVGRIGWFAGHLSVALIGSAAVLAAGGIGAGLSYGLAIGDLGQVPRVTGAALAYLPAVWIVIAVAVAAYGILPRAVPAIAWAFFVYCLVALLFTESFDLPAWFDDASPLSHTPRAPLEQVGPGVVLTLLMIASAGIAAGLAGLRRRDFGG